MVSQKEVTLNPYPRGFHLITDEVVRHLPKLTGVANIFIKHTSASLTINENADPTVREDFETHFNKLVSEKETHYKHTFEGPDDMTSHIKSSILGSSVSFPINDGVPLLGVWQGIYLCEHRNGKKTRKIIITSYGEV
jgi:secondary thiamine-phosphate synthase enzyme